jgi:hypothetical protein
MPPNATEASDINLAKIQEKKMLQSYEKREGNNIVKVRTDRMEYVSHHFGKTIKDNLTDGETNRSLLTRPFDAARSTESNRIQIQIHLKQRHG